MLEIYNSTIANELPPGSTLPVVATGLANNDTGQGAVRIASSIFGNPPGLNCSGLMQSLSGNIGRDASCATNGPGDRVLPNLAFGTFGDHAGLVPTLALTGASGAVDNGRAAYCPATDARSAGRNGPIAGGVIGCDAGAYEFGGGSILSGIIKGGLNGLFMSQTSDSHLLTLQRVNDREALAIWNTFDTLGNNLRLYGVGPVDGSTIRVALARNIGGVFTPNSGSSGSTAVIWGTLEFVLSNCLTGVVRYQSNGPAFGQGEFPIGRLGYVHELGCSE